jgi:hypothetical protein
MEFVRFSPAARFEIWGRARPISLIIATLGAVASLVISIESIQELLANFSLLIKETKLHLGLEFLIGSAFAAGADQAPVYPGVIKSAIIAIFILALFIAFLWALFTVSKSTNAKAVDVATEVIKTLSGFFIGALTGFLG